MSKIVTKWITDSAVTTAKLDAQAVTSAKLGAVAGDGLAGGAGAALTTGASVVRTTGVNPFAAAQSMGGFKLTSLGTPTAAADAATKAYVDATAEGLDVKASVRAATTAALPANTRTGNVLTASANGALAAQDGVTLVVGNRLLVKDEATGANNGIYTVTDLGAVGAPWILTRATDADADADVTSGLFTWIEEGTTNADSGWMLTTNNPITLNTTALAFTQFSGAGQITAGAGLTKTGNTLDVGAGNGINVAADSVAVKADVTTGGDTAAVTVAANGVGLNVTTLDGDHLTVDYAEANYTPVTGGLAADIDDLAAHLKGIDNKLGTLSPETVRQEMHQVTAGENTAGSFTLGATPENAQSVRIGVVGGPHQVNAGSATVVGTPDFEVVGTTCKINASSTPSVALSGDIATGDVLIIVYAI